MNMSSSYDIFVSYPHEEREWASQLASVLAERGLRVWFGEKQIKPGESWIDGVKQGLQASNYFVFIITSRVIQSNWAALELGAALGLNKSIIPIIAADVTPDEIPGPARLRRYILKSDPATVAEEIVRAISNAPESEKIPA